jgi:hypothetical protein
MAPRKIRLSEGAKLPPSLMKRIEARGGVEFKPQKKEKGDIDLKAPKIVMDLEEEFEEEEEMATPWGAILLSIFLAGILVIGMLMFLFFLLNETRGRGVDHITPAGFVTTEVPVPVSSGSEPIFLDPNVQDVPSSSSGSDSVILDPSIREDGQAPASSGSDSVILGPSIREDGQTPASSGSDLVILDPGVQENDHPRELIPSGNISCSVIGDTVLISYSYQNGNDVSLYRDEMFLVNLGGGSDSGSYSVSLPPGTHLLTLKNGGDVLFSAIITIYQEQSQSGPIILDTDNVVLIE